MSNPFIITDRTAISLSGGCTSAFMLNRVLEANGGLPDGVEVCFANTGKEVEATLRFVRDIGINWGVQINWIEYRNDEQGYALVDFDSASRGGGAVRGADRQAPIPTKPGNKVLHGRVEDTRHA